MEAPEELVRLCEREWPRLVGTLTLFCGDQLVAEDLAQEALLRVCDRWPKVSGMSAPGAWLHRVAINLAKSHFRRRKAEQHAVRRRAHESVPGHQHEPAETVAVRDAVACLPVRQREAVAMRFCLQWTVAQTAAAMGTSESAVWSLTYRASKTLRRQLISNQETDRVR